MIVYRIGFHYLQQSDGRGIQVISALYNILIEGKYMGQQFEAGASYLH